LKEEGFEVVRLVRMDDLEKPLENPEKENRVVVLAKLV
jgi:hypothetical protein